MSFLTLYILLSHKKKKKQNILLTVLISSIGFKSQVAEV